ncbi:hypothetical protein BJ970_004902 [Saccharopolyspora phatthalungensis]|uniref:Uncharacterized protein n=1 Tax=Saccharopolyspora phatthalungensis TaxID=664693 RepID=A0A840QF87_9PSEU|nr:hypothetical protein [Saccharopolyspora phatthalungensis]
MQRADTFEPADPRTLLGPAIDPFVGRGDIDECHLPGSGQKRCVRGRLTQELPVHTMQLQAMSVSERPQKSAHSGGGLDLVEHDRHRRVPKAVDVIDTVGARGHRRHHREHFRRRVGPAAVVGPADTYRLADQLTQPGSFRQPHHRDQPGIRDQVRIIKHRAQPCRTMRRSHSRDALSLGPIGSFSKINRPSSGGHLAFLRPNRYPKPPVDRGLVCGTPPTGLVGGDPPAAPEGHVYPCAADQRLDHRRDRWPHTPSRHVQLTTKSALRTTPVSQNSVKQSLSDNGFTIERIRADRILREALTAGPDPLHLSLVFGISHNTARRYTTVAERLLSDELEQPVEP